MELIPIQESCIYTDFDGCDFEFYGLNQSLNTKVLPMDGKRIQDYWSSEVDALVKTYQQFETLIPAPKGAGAEHKGEDGRFVEDLLREYLNRYLPNGLEGGCQKFCVRGAHELVHGGGRRLRRTTDAVGKSVLHSHAATLVNRSP